MSYPIKRSFSAGQLSESMHYRSDIPDVFDRGTSIMKNMVPDTRGACHSRNGTSLYDVLTNHVDVKLVRFQSKYKGDVVIALGNAETNIYSSGIAPDYSTNYIVNNDFNTDLSSWTVTAGVLWKSPFVNTSTTGNAEFTTTGAGTGESIYQDLPDLDINTTHIVKITRTQNIGSDGYQDYRLILDNTDFTVTKTYNVTDQKAVFYAIFKQETAGVPVRLTIETQNIQPGEPDPRIHAFDFIDVHPETTSVTGKVVLSFPIPAVYNSHYEMEPGQDTMFLTNVTNGVYEINYFKNLNLWTIENTVFSNNHTLFPIRLPWQEIVIDGLGGIEQPSVLSFYNGRLYLGNTFEEPNVIWGSNSGNVRNFDVGDPSNIVASDALTLPIAKNGVINWIKGAERLFVGMNNSEQIISSVSGFIQPGDAQVDQNSENGSAKIQPVLYDSDLIYVDVNLKRIKAMNYNDIAKKWLSKDISFYSEDLLDSGILDMSILSGKYITLLMTVNDRSNVVGIMEQNGKSIGFSKFESNGQIRSSIQVLESDLPYMYTASYVNGQFVLHKEDVISNIDSSIAQIVSPASSLITGLTHLSNMVVQATTIIGSDTIYLGEFTVSSIGEVQLNDPVSQVTIGLEYEIELETLPVAIDGQNGNDFSATKRFAEIYIQLLNSARPIVNGYDTFTRNSSTLMDVEEPLKTELLTVPNNGRRKDERVNISQKLPYRTEVAVISAKYASKKI